MFQPSIFEDQQEVSHIIYDAMNLFWHDYLLPQLHAQYFPNQPSLSKFALIQLMLEKASRLAPYRLDLLYNIAFFQISQGKVEEAVKLYGEIAHLTSQSYNAKILQAVYSRQTYGLTYSQEKIAQCWSEDPVKTDRYKKGLAMADSIIKETDFASTPFLISEPRRHFIVVLGFALNEDGSMKEIQLNRLKLGLQMYQLNPGSKFMLSGGFPKAGRTESYMMMNWLLSEDVPLQDMVLEEESKDTLGNALYSLTKLKAAGAETATIISSLNHLRRVKLLFQSISQQRELKIDLSYLGEGTGDIGTVTSFDELMILRDVMRAWGIWALPSLFR